MNTSVHGHSLSEIKEGITVLLETAYSANVVDIGNLVRRVVDMRYKIAVLTNDMDLPDPCISWQIDRLDLVKALLVDRVDVFETQRIISEILEAKQGNRR